MLTKFNLEMDMEEIENKTQSLGLYNLGEVGDLISFSNENILIEENRDLYEQPKPYSLIGFFYDETQESSEFITFIEVFDNNEESIEAIVDRYKEMVLEYNQESLDFQADNYVDRNVDGEIDGAYVEFTGNIEAVLVVEYFEDEGGYNKEIIMVTFFLGNPM